MLITSHQNSPRPALKSEPLSMTKYIKVNLIDRQMIDDIWAEGAELAGSKYLGLGGRFAERLKNGE